MFQRIRQLRAHYGLRRGIPREFRLQYRRFFRRQSERKLANDLAKLGVEKGASIFVHSSLSRIGYVSGGPDTLIHALQEAVGPEGTIVMPSYPFGGLAYDYVRTNPVFDVRTTPTDVGVVSERFRALPGVVRSLHPTHAVCAWGKRAEWLVADHDRVVYPFGPDTPFFRFMELGGSVLLLGARFQNMTMLRVIEDENFPFDVYHPGTFRLKVVDGDSRESWVDTKVHSHRIAPYRRAKLLVPYLQSQGLVTSGLVGMAESSRIDCTNLFRVLAQLLSQGITQYVGNP